MGSVRPRLGELLLARGACTREQLRAAWEQKVLFGDRLGTNLLAIGAASEETVATALGVQFGLHAGHGNVLRVEKSALDLIPAKQADKSGIVPHHVADKTLYLLMRDPLDVMAIDEVRFRTNLRVAPVVICEARLWQLLELHYGVRASLRPIDLDGTSRAPLSVQRSARRTRAADGLPEETGPLAVADLVSQADFERLYAGMHEAPNLVRGADVRADADNDGPTAEMSAPVAGQPPEVSADAPDFLAPPRAKDWTTWRDAIEKTSPMLARPVLSDENAGSTDGAIIELVETQPTLVTPQEPRHQQTLELHQAISAEAAVDVEQPLSINAAAVLLKGAEDRTAIGKLILRAARARFSRACLLTVFPDRVTGWLGIGDGFETATLRNVLIDRQAQSVFQLVVDSRAHYVGPLRRYPAHGAWVKATGRQIPKSVAVFPILVRGRPVNLLYVDNGHEQHVNADVGEILILAQAIAKTYEGLLQTL